MKPCLPGLVADGKLSQEQADRAGALFDELSQDFRRQFGDQAADKMATDAALKALAADAARKRLLAGLTIQTRQRLEMEMRAFNGGKGSDGAGGGPIDPSAGPAFLGGDGRATYSNVDGRHRAVRGRAHAMMDEILAKHSSNVLGEVRARAELEDLVRELFGEDSGNANARELAGAWTDAAEMLRQRFNAAGGDIGKLDHWGLPQSHDSRQVRAAGYDTWKAEILPRLDREKMIDGRTGLPFTDQSLELALRDVFETIRTDGWNDRAPGGVGGGSLANRRGEGRFLIFKSADDWMAYAAKFGAGNAFDAMMSHVDGMSRDIAMMEILGPNPAATVQWLKGSIAKSAAEDTTPDSKAVDQAHAAGKQIDRLYAELTGASSRPENRKLALTFSALRSWQTATKLGGAMLSAVTDWGFQWRARSFNGLASHTMLGDYFKLFRPGSIEDQKLAVRLGLIAEEWSSRTASQGRYLSEELTGETTRRLAEGVLRASGLARFTQAGRWAFGMEMLGHITDEAGKRFDALDPAFRGALERYGFTAADWDTIRATPLEEDRGIGWIKLQNVADRALGDRLLEMIARETDYAVPVTDLATRAMINSVAPKGTWHGEIIRSAALFKGFGISVMHMQLQRIMEMSGPNRLRYMAGLTIATTMMGALALALKDVAAGRDPRGMDPRKNPAFWGQAVIQGGGFAIFGDFLNSSTNRSGGGLAGTLAGPIISDVQDVAAIATSKNKQGAALKTLRRQIPGGTLWYARLAFDRQVADQLQEAVDPNYRQSWRRAAHWAQEQGTGYWWAPGDFTPSRAPDMANIERGASLDTRGGSAGASP
jgi:hypothetical protein